MDKYHKILVFVNEKNLTGNEIKLATALVRIILENDVVGNYIKEFHPSIYEKMTGIPKRKIPIIFKQLCKKDVIKRHDGGFYIDGDLYFDGTMADEKRYKQFFDNL